MDEHTIKRLVKIIVASIIVIMLANYFLTKAATNLTQAAVEKQQAAAQQQPTPSTDTVLSDVVPETLTASEVIDVAAASSDVAASSSVEGTAP